MTGTQPLSEEQAEAYLHSLELFGMRFGLDRMRRMMTALGSPQRSYDCIQVLGTNGKTSTTRMTAAILERHGLATATYTSPHLISYRERLQIGERDISAAQFARAIARAAAAAKQVNRTLEGDDHVTQFELLTAAALWEAAESAADVAVIEAGLGGRYDATSVIEAKLTVLTNVGLEHTRWLGPTVHDIAEEKLAVVQRQGTLVLGADLAPEARAVADRVAREREARIVVAQEDEQDPLGLGAAGAFQRRNFALARTAARLHLWDAGIELDEGAVREAAASTTVRGRLQVVSQDPLTVLDGAHNPDAVRALVESLPALVAERPLALVLGVLEDKDAVGMLGPLLERCERAWFTAPPSERALSPAALQSLARQLGFEEVSSEPRPAAALAQAQRWAKAQAESAESGAQAQAGAVLATGSVYLVGDLLAAVGGAATGATGAAEGLHEAAHAQDSRARRRRALP